MATAAVSRQQPNDYSPSRATILALYSGFFLTGLITALLGPLIPSLRTHFGVSTSQIGSLFVAQFLGSSLGSLFSQWRLRISITVGLAFTSVGLFVFPLAPWSLAPISVFSFGVGLGLIIPATNMYVAQARPDSRAASLNVLNLVWGAGAVTSPIVVACLSNWLSFPGALFVIAAIAGATCLCSFAVKKAPPSEMNRTESANDAGTFGTLAVFCLMLFLYIGIETAVAGWTASHVGDIASVQWWATSSVAGFWGALLAGRAFAPFALRRITERMLLSGSLAVAIFTMFGLLLTRSALFAWTLATLTGFALAPLFALLLSMLSAFASSNRIAIPGWVFSAAGTGGAALPWTVGYIASRTGSIRFGLVVPALALIALACIRQTVAIRSFER